VLKPSLITIVFLSAIGQNDFSDFYSDTCHNIAMLPKTLMKNPILMIGILLMTIFLFQLNQKGYFSERREKLMATSCRAALVKLNRRIPASWTTKCEGNNMAVEIPLEFKLDKKLDKKTSSLKLKTFMYREMANDFVVIAKNSPSDNLERTDFVRLKMMHENLEINAITEGRFLVKLATIKNKRLLAEHLKTTVNVKETIK
jgi:hypothetical protein